SMYRTIRTLSHRGWGGAKTKRLTTMSARPTGAARASQDGTAEKSSTSRKSIYARLTSSELEMALLIAPDGMSWREVATVMPMVSSGTAKRRAISTFACVGRLTALGATTQKIKTYIAQDTYWVSSSKVIAYPFAGQGCEQPYISRHFASREAL